MKKIFKWTFALCLLVILNACSKDDDDNGMSAQAAANLKTGTWKVYSYVEDGIIKTIDYQDYVFTFTDGSVTATSSALTATGSWFVEVDGSTPKLNLVFTAPPLFAELSEDWEIQAVTSTAVSMHHSSSNGMDMLIFQKN